MAKAGLIGTNIILGKLTLGEELGRGGFGVVHEATLEGIDHRFAIKLLEPSNFTDHESARRRFFQEANFLFRLRHRYIVPIYGVGEHEGRPYILMERFQGMNFLQARAAVTQPSPEQVLPVVIGVTEALVYAHSINVIHRDISPRNLMTLKAEPRVLDFGLATIVDPTGERFTRTGSMGAVDAYSAPELHDNPALVDPRCDLYSVGACWFFLLTGRPPKGLNIESTFRAAARTATKAYEDVLMRCLDQIENRYPSAAALLADLQRLANGEAPTASGLTDEEARVLGIVYCGCPSSTDSISLYNLEHEIGGRQSRLLTTAALKKLIAQGYLSTKLETDFNGEEFVKYQTTTRADDWVEKNKGRVEALLAKPSPPPVTYDSPTDDIPF